MLYVGLSGGIGSGKSTVSTRLAELGAVVIDADRIARDVVATDTPGLAAVVRRFGTRVLSADGSLDRPALGAVVFSDEQARRDLEAIVHPLVRNETLRQRAAAPREAVVVHDVPLLVEGDLAPDHHLTVIVDAAEERRVDRIVRDRGMDAATARARVAAQATDEQRYAVADVVLDNDGTREALLDQVESLWHERLSPYNRNLLAERGARRAAGEVDPGTVQRSLARVRRQVAAAEPTAGVEDLRVAGDDVIELRLRRERVVDDALRAALRAAGFVSGQEEGIFLGCDPGAPLALRVRSAAG